LGGEREGKGVLYICLSLYNTGIGGRGRGGLCISVDTLFWRVLRSCGLVMGGGGREGGGVSFLRFLYFELHTELHTAFHGILFALAMVQ